MDKGHKFIFIKINLFWIENQFWIKFMRFPKMPSLSSNAPSWSPAAESGCSVPLTKHTHVHNTRAEFARVTFPASSVLFLQTHTDIKRVTELCPVCVQQRSCAVLVFRWRSLPCRGILIPDRPALLCCQHGSPPAAWSTDWLALWLSQINYNSLKRLVKDQGPKLASWKKKKHWP